MSGLLTPTKIARLPASENPILLAVVDTEEEFDWAKPHDRSHTSVSAMSNLSVGQRIFDEYGVKPCYVVDYPIVAQHRSAEPLAELLAEHKCHLGAHLHPWVNPPYEEAVTTRNSFPGNLPVEMERAKLERLKAQIKESLGVEVSVYKAGRYGIGANTAKTLEALGFVVDLSSAAGFDYSADGGPDFFTFPNDPYWFGSTDRLLSIPCTGGLAGLLARRWPELYRYASHSLARKIKLPGVLSRARLIERIRLSPEGFSADEMMRLTDELLDRGVRVFTLSFHSPSLAPGCTPYVRSEADLEHFLATIADYLEYFLGSRNGRSLGPLAIRDLHLARLKN